MGKAKSFDISKKVVWEAYKRVKANRGAAGVDRQSLEAFEEDLEGNLYKLWNRMSSGSYFPPAVRRVEIPKGGGGKRPLGIPTVTDRIAQTVAKMYLEPEVEPVFHLDSYGYRPGKSALDAVATARKRCWRKDWVIDLDIKGFFDNLDHDLTLRAVCFHTDLKWVHLYVERWLKAPVQLPDGTLEERSKGTPQGGVISPLLANLFMHHAFDDWLRRHHPHVQFERYADDAVLHCASEEQARHVLGEVRQRLAECGLELHPEKTRVVYCQDDDRRGKHEHIAFDFLGYTFQPRRARNRWGRYFVSFLPAISNRSAKRIRQTIRGWRIAATRNNQSLEDLATLTDPYVRGWMNYYGRFYRSRVVQVLRHLNHALIKWAQRKYPRRYRRKERAAARWLRRIANRDPHLLVLWRLGIKPAATG
jgi:group II intron reverse transcriptase/maturase